MVRATKKAYNNGYRAIDALYSRDCWNSHNLICQISSLIYSVPADLCCPLGVWLMGLGDEKVVLRNLIIFLSTSLYDIRSCDNDSLYFEAIYRI